MKINKNNEWENERRRGSEPSAGCSRVAGGEKQDEHERHSRLSLDRLLTRGERKKKESIRIHIHSQCHWQPIRERQGSCGAAQSGCLHTGEGRVAEGRQPMRMGCACVHVSPTAGEKRASRSRALLALALARSGLQWGFSCTSMQQAEQGWIWFRKTGNLIRMGWNSWAVKCVSRRVGETMGSKVPPKTVLLSTNTAPSHHVVNSNRPNWLVFFFYYYDNLGGNRGKKRDAQDRHTSVKIVHSSVWKS